MKKMNSRSIPRIAAAALLAGAGLMGAGAVENERPIAFPGAEGFGRYTTGGRGGKVYHVTNLADDGRQGSLRWALQQSGPRTIVFDVSGTIHLKSGLRFSDNTTLAGQTAPGDGICIADYPVQLGSNNIVRYVRFRLGNTNVKQDGADGWDGLTAMDGHDIIVDHCSVSWSIDECCSILGNVNTTLQWTIVAQSLVNSGHSKGAHGYGGNWGGSGASFHHNLIIHHTSRTPRLGPRPTTQEDERMDMRNNVIYNFGGNGCYGGEGMTVNIVNNYYKPGPGSPTDRKGRRIAGIGIRTNSYCATFPAYAPMLHVWGKYYVTGNVNTKYADVTRDNWNYGMYNQIDTSESATDGTWNDQVKKDIRLAEPMEFVAVTTHSAEDAYQRVVDYCGASLHRDAHDTQMIADLVNGTATYTGSGLGKGFINSQDDNRPADASADWSAWPALVSQAAPADTDRDGMPDEWETANGLDPQNPNDRNLTGADGYTHLERYLNSLVESITEAQNEGGVMEGVFLEPEPVEESYEISGSTADASRTSFGYGITVSNLAGGGYNVRNEYFGCGRDQQHIITLPIGAEIKWVKVTGFPRYAGDNFDAASLTELNGNEYAAGTYALSKNATQAAPETFEVDLSEPAANTLTMTWKGNNPWMKLWLYTTDSSGIEDVAADREDSEDADSPWYNLQGMRVSEPLAPGIYIRNGKKHVIR